MNEIKKKIALAVAITIVLLVLKGRVEETDFGKLVEEMSYGLLQHNLSSSTSTPAKDLPVMVLDISSIHMVTVPGILQSKLVTEREPLAGIVKSLFKKQPPPLAIGLDVDFSPDEYGYAAPADSKFFKDLMDESNTTKIPIFVGVNSSLALGPGKWLRNPNYISLATCIVVPNPEPGQSTRYMPEWVEVQYANEQPGHCHSMGAALASATVRAVPAWMTRFVESARSTDPAKEKLAYASTFLVDYSPLDMLRNSTREINSSDEVDKIDVGKKIVLIGRTRETNDVFVVPGSGEPFPGVFLHACAAYTLLQKKPLYYLTESGRILLDILFSSLLFGIVLSIQLQFAKDGREEFMENHLPDILSFIVALALVFGTITLVRHFHLMWDDFLLVAVVLIVHHPLERTTKNVYERVRNFLFPAKQESSRHHSENQK